MVKSFEEELVEIYNSEEITNKIAAACQVPIRYLKPDNDSKKDIF